MRRTALLLAALLLSACTSAGDQDVPPEPEPVHFGACAELPKGDSELPDVTLPCFSGGEQVRLGQLAGPLVVNFWASWCGPCRAELPAFQRLADERKVTVLGVATDDQRAASLAMAQDLGIKFPMLDDPGGELRRALGEAALPLTLFVRLDGKVSSYSGPALTDETLTQLVGERIGPL